MLDIKFIRENLEIVKEAAKKKKVDVDLDKLLALDDQRREILQSVEAKKQEQNEVSNRIVNIKDEREREFMILDMKKLKDRIQEEEDVLKKILNDWRALMLKVPNVPDFSVPNGESDEENVEIRTWGEKPKFDFELKDHVALLEDLDLADFERGAKVSGFRGYFMKNDGALLFFALWQYFLNYFVTKGYTPMIVPSLVKKETLLGTGYIPDGEDDLYKTQDGDYFAGTAEVAMMSYLSQEIVDKKSLPLKFIAFSPCFRREAGSHGKDVKGIIRVHEFFKLEQVILSEASHEESVRLHEEITAHVEHLMQELKIPYRVVVNCGGDLGLGQVKKYDLEAWMPSQNKYRETHSSSYFHDFQTRRLNIKYKDDDGKTRYTHSLNNTACATSRLPASILENFQQKDGSIKIPDVLVPFMGKDTITKK